jgi:hypothetical protein
MNATMAKAVLGFRLERERREPNKKRQQHAQDLSGDDEARVWIFERLGRGQSSAIGRHHASPCPRFGQLAQRRGRAPEA